MNNDNFKESKCIHVFPSEKDNSSLIKINRRIMVVPKTYDCVCKCCGKIIRYIISEDGTPYEL